MDEPGSPSVNISSRSQPLTALNEGFSSKRNDKDDDDISLTSTVDSEPQEEYEVEGIYHQLTFPDGIKYLVKWKGYPDYRCTWEPAESFSNPHTLREWKKIRRQIVRGERPSFDYGAWEDEVRRWWGGKKERKQRRRAKRIRQGIPVGPETSDEEEDILEELVEGDPDDSPDPELDSLFNEIHSDSDEVPLINSLTHRLKRTLESSPSSKNVSQLAALPGRDLANNSKPVDRHSQLRQQPPKRPKLVGERAAATVPAVTPAHPTPPASTTGAATGITQDISPLQNAANQLGLKEHRPSIHETANNPSIRASKAPQKPSGALPKQPPQPAASFASSSGPARKQTRVPKVAPPRSNQAQGSSKPATFRTLSTQNKYQKASRYEPHPNVNQLDLRAPADWVPMKDHSRLPPPLAREASSDSLFVDQMSEGQPSTSSSANGLDNGGSSLVSKIPSANTQEIRSAKPTGLNTPIAYQSPGPNSAAVKANPNEPGVTPSSTSAPNVGMKIRDPTLSGSRPATGRLQQELSKEVSRRPSNQPMVNFRGRLISKGDTVCGLYYGRHNFIVGEVRLCGFSSFVREELVAIYKRYHEVKLPFNHTCTVENFFKMRGIGKASPTGMHHGFILGFDDTNPSIDKVAEDLKSHNEMALFNLGEKSAMICYQRDLPDIQIFRRKQLSLKGSRSLEKDAQLLVTVVSETYNLQSLTRRDTALSSPTKRHSLPIHQGKQEKDNQDPKAINSDRPVLKIDPKVVKESLSPNKKGPPTPSTRITSPPSGNALSAIATASAFNPTGNITNLNNSDQSDPVAPIPQGNPPLALSHLSSPPILIDRNIPANNSPLPLDAQTKGAAEDVQMTDAGDSNEMNLDKFFLENYNITFNRLCTVRERTEVAHARTFYLWFPPEAEPHRQLLTELLWKHRSSVFSNSTATDWKNFRQNERNMKCAAIIFHESFSSFGDLPEFNQLLQDPVNVWCASLTTPLQGLQEKTYFQRIFPHGMILLITEDFMVKEKKATVVILRWIRDTWEGRMSRLLFLRPSVISWLIEKVNDQNGDVNADSNSDLYPVIFSLIIDIASRRGFYTHPIKRTDLDPTFNPISQLTVASLASLPDYGSRTVKDSPALHPSLTLEENKADHLIEFFAGWSLIHRDKFRKFMAVTSVRPLQRWQKWQHLKILHSVESIFSTLRIHDPAKQFDAATKYKTTSLRTSTPLGNVEQERRIPVAIENEPSRDPRLNHTHYSKSSEATPTRGPQESKDLPP